jgi:hypothetical protein
MKPLTVIKQRILTGLFIVLFGFAYFACSAELSPDQIARSALPENSALMNRPVELDLGKLCRAVIVIFRASPQNTTLKGLGYLSEPSR